MSKNLSGKSLIFLYNIVMIVTNIFKTLANFVFKGTLRSVGIPKGLTTFLGRLVNKQIVLSKANCWDQIKKLTKSVAMNELKRTLPIICYLDRLGMLGSKFSYVKSRYGIQSFLVGVAQNKFVPVEIRKIWYLIDAFRKGANKDLVLNNIKTAVDIGTDWSKKLTNENMVDLLINIDDAFPDPKDRKKQLEKVINSSSGWITFAVNSPQTHNFSQGTHRYNFITQDYLVPIRGWNGAITNYYLYMSIHYVIIALALEKADYGKLVFSRFRSD